MKSSQVNEMGNFWEIPPSLKNCILSQYLTVTRGHICWDIQLYNTCADHPNIHQSQKCQLYEKVRFNSITLPLSSLTKFQTEAILHPNVLFDHHSKTTYPSPGYYASFWRVHTIHDPDLLQLLSRWWGVERYAGISHGGCSWHEWMNDSLTWILPTSLRTRWK